MITARPASNGAIVRLPLHFDVFQWECYMLVRAGLAAVGCAATGMDYCAWTTGGSGDKNC